MVLILYAERDRHLPSHTSASTSRPQLVFYIPYSRLLFFFFLLQDDDDDAATAIIYMISVFSLSFSRFLSLSLYDGHLG
jgi:hypothetical protein